MSTGRGTATGPGGPAVSARPAGRRWYLVLPASGAAVASGAISLGAPAGVMLWTAAGVTGVLLAMRLLIGLDQARTRKRANSTLHQKTAE